MLQVLYHLVVGFFVLWGVQSEDVMIPDGDTLMKCLCNRTVPQHTSLLLSQQELVVTGSGYCLVENTSNISIMPSNELLKGVTHVRIVCLNDIAFGFVNVTNLTLSSVIFVDCVAIIPQEAIKLVEGSAQFWYYDNVSSTLFFSHCYSLTICNISVNQSNTHYSGYDIIGVNLCGLSNITMLLPDDDFEHYPLVQMFIYFTDSKMEKKECNLNIKSNTISSHAENNAGRNILNQLINSDGDSIPISLLSNFALYLAQQHFDVEATVSIGPQNKSLTSQSKPELNEPMNIVIGFINSITASHISFQGLGVPYQVCTERSRVKPASNCTLRSLVLAVVFYENSLFPGSNITFSPLSIRDTSFTSLHDLSNEHNSIAMLQVFKVSGKTSYEVLLENISWCDNDLTDYLNPTTYSIYPFHAENIIHTLPITFPPYGIFGDLILKFENISMHHNKFMNDQAFHKSPNYLMYFYGVNSIMSGFSYFADNAGGTVIKMESSNLTITGNFTLRDGYGITGGGICLDSYSTLFLKEPLTAGFYNNRADRGSAVYAPIRRNSTKNYEWDCIGNRSCDLRRSLSVIQVVPNQIYSVENVTNINITLLFWNNRNNNIKRSLYAPRFNFLGTQTSEAFLFKAQDFVDSRFAYTTMIDALFPEDMDLLDKYTSLSNGVCIQPHGEQWECKYIDRFYLNSTSLHRCQNRALYDIVAYPGARVLSVLYMDTTLYDVGYCSHVDNRVYQYRYQEYQSWSTTQIEGNSTQYFRIYYHDSIPKQCANNTFMILLTNIEANIMAIPIVQVNMSAREYCPVGFELTKSGSCNCLSNMTKHNYNCDIDTMTFTSQLGYWTGVQESQHNIVTIRYDRNCPPNYCNYNMSNFRLDNSLSELSCHGNREGFLCGECKDNYSAVFGSDDCFDYCNAWYLLTIPVYAVTGFLLVLLLFVLRLDVATGNIIGVVFYANVLGIVMNKLTEKESTRYVVFSRIAISLLNLDLGFPLCFYKGMTLAVKVGLQFVFPVYLWVIVIGFIMASKYSIRLSGLVSRSSVQVLATLFYLSFSKLLHTVIQIFSSSVVTVVTYSSETSYSEKENTVWFFSGEDYGHSTHALLLTMAVIFTVLFLAPYAVFVTFSYYFIRWKAISKFKPFIDAYSGPFKDRYRFWFGLRIWATVVLFGVDGFLQGRSTDSMFIVHIVLIITLTLLQVFIRPFKNYFIGLLDSFYMLNYWLIIEVYYLANSMFLSTYIVLTTAALFVLCLMVAFQVFTWKRFIAKSSKRAEYQVLHEDNADSDFALFRAAEERSAW